MHQKHRSECTISVWFRFTSVKSWYESDFIISMSQNSQIYDCAILVWFRFWGVHSQYVSDLGVLYNLGMVHISRFTFLVYFRFGSVQSRYGWHFEVYILSILQNWSVPSRYASHLETYNLSTGMLQIRGCTVSVWLAFRSRRLRVFSRRDSYP